MLVTGIEYHHYFDAKVLAKKKYGCFPSDYSILDRWGLIKSHEGKGGDKFKALTDKGKDFLDGKIKIQQSHFKIPHTEVIIFSKQRVGFDQVRDAWLKKNKKEPFLVIKDNEFSVPNP